MKSTDVVRALSATAGLLLLAGCSSGLSPTIAVHAVRANQHFIGRAACPLTGPIKYVSDALLAHSVINVYAGRFAGQAPCGQIVSGLNSPVGLFVRAGSHDLYVANTFGSNNIQVFHRGQTTPYNTYTNPSPPGVPVDVAVAKDGTVIATYSNNRNHRFGFLATWIGGPNGGTFVGNFPMKRDGVGEFLTVRRNGVVYFDEFDDVSGAGSLWSVSCPAGACGAQTKVAGVSLSFPGGMAIDATGDVLVADAAPGAADTFELPNTKPRSFALAGTPTGMAINELDHHWFVADYRNNDAAEYSYPDGALIGTVAGDAGGLTFGVAVDP
jgi:hypothetical protein